MVKKVILFILTLFCFVKCANKIKLTNKVNNSSNIEYSRLYLRSYFIKDKNQIDSAKYLQGYCFFSNGIFRKINLAGSQLNENYITEYFDKYKIQKDNWGVYEIKNDSLILRGWGASQGNPVYMSVGKTYNNTVFQIIKGKCISCSKFEYGYEWSYFNFNYVLSDYKVNVDSTTSFISPKIKTTNK